MFTEKEIAELMPNNKLPYTPPVHLYQYGTQYEIRDQMNKVVLNIVMEKFHLDYRAKLLALCKILVHLLNGTGWIEQNAQGVYSLGLFGVEKIAAEMVRLPVMETPAMEEEAEEEEAPKENVPISNSFRTGDNIQQGTGIDGARLGGDPDLKREIIESRRGRGRPVKR